jgi:Zn-dependent peptidase ImmA (M78 family)
MKISAASNLLFDWDGTLPVDPVFFARKRGIAVKYRPSLKKDVPFTFDSAARTVYVNPGNPEYRQRFAAACGLGHILLEHGESRPLMPEPQERAAKFFAAELLIPEIALREMAPRFSLNEMAWFFDVSRVTLFLRMKALRIVK